MDRKKAFTIEVSEESIKKLTATEAKALLKSILVDKDIEASCTCFELWCDDPVLEKHEGLIKSKKALVKKNFPKGRFVVDAKGEFWSNDNSERMGRLSELNIESSDLKKVVKKLPKNYTLTYDYVMNEIGLKSDVVGWIKARGLDIPLKLSKGGMQEAIIKLYHLSKGDIVSKVN